MRIATWNVNSINARLSFVLGWLRERKPDVAMLQELKLADDAFPHEAFRELGYRVATHGQPKWNGVAIVTRTDAEIVQSGLPGAEADGARALTVRHEGFHFTSVYVPNGQPLDHADFDMKLRWLDRLAEYVEGSLDASTKVVIGGDFNLVPAGVDTHQPELTDVIFHTDDERRRYARLLEAGYVDLYRVKNPDGRMFSWWDYRAGCFHKNLGLRIDFLLASASVAACTTEVWIDRDFRKKHDGETPSDHAPVIADLSD